MDLKTVMPNVSTPNTTEIPSEMPVANATVDGKAVAQVPGDSLIIGLIEMLKVLSAKTANAVNEQNLLLQMLPKSVRDSAEHILQQSLPNLNTLSAGLTSLLHSRRDAAHSLAELAQKLQWATGIFPSTAKPDEIVAEIKHFQQQVKAVLEQIALKTGGMDQADLQQVSEQIRSAIPQLLRQAALGLSQSGAAANPSVPANILKAADVLNLPELPQLWLLTELDSEDLSPDSLPKDSNLVKDGSLSKDSSPVRDESLLKDSTLPKDGSLSKDSILPKDGLVAIKQDAAQVAGKEPLTLPLNASQAKPAAELLNEIKRFAQQITEVLSQLDFDAQEIDPARLQQAREQVRSAISDLMRQTAENFASLAARSGGTAIPVPIRQAAVLLNLPELLQLWPLSDKELVALLTTTPPNRLEQSAGAIRTLAELVNRAFIINSDDQGQAAVFTLQMPFLGESTHPQPIHIHIYHEKGRKKPDGSTTKPDTWVRMALEPEHTGPVTAIFHLREAAILDIKVVFEDKTASLLFAERVSAIRKACGDLPFLLGDVSII